MNGKKKRLMKQYEMPLEIERVPGRFMGRTRWLGEDAGVCENLPANWE